MGCLGCGVELTKRHQKVFCSNSCQRAMERAATWNGLDLRFVLDHVDGDSTNNARGNLRLICPNCDSQLPTFKARNRGNGRAWRRQRYADGKSY